MSYFSYKAIGPDGELVRGFTEAENIDFVFETLSIKGLSVLDVKRAGHIAVFLRKTFAPRRIAPLDIIEFANSLSVMLRAGVPLLTALDDIIHGLDNKTLKNAVVDIKRLVEAGMRLSDAAESQKGLFPDIMVRLARIGEETGRLDKSLSDAAGHLQKMEDLSQAIRSALIYPLFAIVTTTGALFFWLVYVLPRLMATMKDLGVKLPLITRALMHVSDFAKGYWFLFPVLITGLMVGIKALKSSPSTKYYIDSLSIRLPILKLVEYNKLLALFSEQMRILTIAGIPVDRSLGITADTMGNEIFRRALHKTRELVSSGSGVAESLKGRNEFPQLVVRMVGLGETSGSLDEQFAFLSDYYLKKLDEISRKIGKMIEPVVISFIGIIFAVVVLSLMLPLYDLISKLGKG